MEALHIIDQSASLIKGNVKAARLLEVESEKLLVEYYASCLLLAADIA